MKRDDILAAIVAISIVVGVILLGAWAISSVQPRVPPRYQGEVIAVTCLGGGYNAAVIKMDAERTFDTGFRDCVFLSAHVGDIVSFEISPGGTALYNFALEEDR